MFRDRGDLGRPAVRELALALCIGWLALEALALAAVCAWFQAPLFAVAGSAMAHLVRVVLVTANAVAIGGVS